MYPEDAPKSTLFSRKRPLPVTPPLSTRRATAETLKSTSVRCVDLASFKLFLKISPLIPCLSDSVSMEQEDVAPGKKLETPSVFFFVFMQRLRCSYLYERIKKQKKVHAIGVEDDHTYADSTQFSDVVKMGSSSSIHESSPTQTASERMVHLLQKPKEERVNSDEEVFLGDTIETKKRSLLSTPSTSDIPIVFVFF